MALAEQQDIQALDPSDDYFINPYEEQDVIVKDTSVQIFKDPLSKAAPEDTATINKVIATDGQRDLALVTLDSNSLPMQRWIKRTYTNGKLPYTLPFKLR